MKNVVLMTNCATQFSDGSKHRTGGRGIEALVNAKVGLYLLIKFRPKVGSGKLANQHLGVCHFFFTKRIEEAHGRTRLLPVLRRLRTFFQGLTIPDPSFARVLG